MWSEDIGRTAALLPFFFFFLSHAKGTRQWIQNAHFSSLSRSGVLEASSLILKVNRSGLSGTFCEGQPGISNMFFLERQCSSYQNYHGQSLKIPTLGAHNLFLFI